MSRELKRARSRYVQVRLTATYGANGFMSWRIQGKEYTDPWDEHSELVVGGLRGVDVPLTVHDVKRMIVDVLLDELIAEEFSVFTASDEVGPASPEGTIGGQ